MSDWLGHPRGLSVLFFTEMWERFSYYGMRSLLLLFMITSLRFSTQHAATIYGTYTMGVYALSIPGGWMADRYLGHYRAVLFGGILITLGHFSMAIPRLETFFLGLALIVCGTGLLKPNVSTLVGSLYTPEDHRRDAGFSIFYMSINLGGMIAPLICGYLGQKVDWHLGFAAAGVGMLLGLTQLVFGRKHVGRALESSLDPSAPDGSRTRPPFTSPEWRRIFVILILVGFTVVFAGGFEQAGSTLTLFAERYTRRSLFGWSFPSSWFQSEQPLFVILLAPLFAWMWIRLGRREPSSATKFAAGLLLTSLGFLVIVPAAFAAGTRGVRVSPIWLTALYLLHTFGELCLSPVGLSLVTKLSPKRIVGLMMGVWFLAMALGNFVAGFIAGFADRVPLYQIFGAVCAVLGAAGILLAFLKRPIQRLAEAEEEEDVEVACVA